MKRLTDTSPEVERILAGVYRAMSPARKWKLLGDAQRLARRLHKTGVRLRNPQATDEDIHRDWLIATVGVRPATDSRGVASVETPEEQLAVVIEIAAALT